MKYKTLYDIKSVNDYNALFNPQNQNQPSKIHHDPQLVLGKALDIRKFEIDLYWKRATYFWAFIAAAFAGYFALSSSGQISPLDKHEELIVLTCIGFVFSLGWFCANRGSKFWQENWESHVNLLEDQVYGPLYKTALDNRNFPLFSITKPYHFSVSKINQILSFFITLIWIFLASKEIALLGSTELFQRYNVLIIMIFTISMAFYIVLGTRGGQKSDHNDENKSGVKKELEFFMIHKKVID